MRENLTDVIHDRVAIGDVHKLTEEIYYVRGQKNGRGTK